MIVGSLGTVNVGGNAIDLMTLLLGAAMPFIAMRFPLIAALLSKFLPKPSPAPGPVPAPAPNPGPEPVPPTPSPAQPDLGLLLQKLLELLGKLKINKRGEVADDPEFESLGSPSTFDDLIVKDGYAYRVKDAVGIVHNSA